jgi:hypothetical protein
MDRRSYTNIFEVLDNNSRRDHEKAEMSEEAEKNHENLIEDNIAKNLQWMVGRSHGEMSDRNKIPSEIKGAKLAHALKKNYAKYRDRVVQLVTRNDAERDDHIEKGHSLGNPAGVMES